MPRVELGAFRPRLVHLLVLLMVPVLVIATPNVGEAATYGQPANGAFEWHPSGPFNDIECTVSGYWVLEDGATVPTVAVQGRCEKGPLATDAPITHLSVTGAQCAFSGTPGSVPDGDPWSISLTAGLSSSLYNRDGCVITEGCVSIDDFGGAEQCFAWNLGQPPRVRVPNGVCTHGTVQMPTADAPQAYSDNRNVVQSINYAVTPGSDTTGYWRLYTVVQRASGDISLSTPTYPVTAYEPAATVANGRRIAITSHGIVAATQTISQKNWVSLQGSYTGGGSLPPGATIVGAGYHWQNTNSAGVLGTPQGAAGSYIGLTQASACNFYWGTKVAVTVNDTYDEPLADPYNVAPPVTTPPTTAPATPDSPPDSSGCDGFTYSDPTTWAGAGVCVLVKLMDALLGVMNSIYGVLKGMVAAIVDGIGGLLNTLFVPSSGFFSAKVASVKDAFADTAPGKWVGALTSFSVPTGSGSGCQGPHVSAQFGHGMDFDTYPLAACSGAAATLASLSRLVLSLWFGYFGGLACVRAVGSGFNWAPGSSGGSS